MPLEIKVPSLGQSVPEATVGKWLKKEGDQVQADEAVVELETDKINMEVTAFRGGTLAEIRKQEGATVAVGEVLGLIAQEGEEVGAGEPEEVAEEEAAAPTKVEEKATGEEGEEEPAGEPEAEPEEAKEEAEAEEKPARRPAAKATRPAAARREAVIPEDMKTSPAVRRLAREHRLDLNVIEGSGKAGRVTREDVLAYLEEAPEEAVPAAAPAEAPSAPEPEYGPDEPVEVVPMTSIRKTIAHRMADSKRTAAHVTTVDECDFGALVELRERIKEDFLAQHGYKLTYLPFIMKASIAALREFPQVNASIRGDDIVFHRFYHIGVAVHTEAGLIVPVVKHADRKSMVEIAGKIDELAKKARERKLTMEDIQGGTFTLTNAGGFGAILSTPIISQPESAVLGIHKIVERPVALNGQVVIRPMMWFGLSYDHRLVDGTPAVQFLRRICELLEKPERLLLEA
ncbi:MAG TPA: 2-oxoglutarate dehydrogenase complex dihydrolipoyllysine-residue succinyltransferase [Gemmatimonadota bacterium]|nr:2-oxoglutarate dehydrogenase complex dihydrolipoyllysine-residue succinyltransferase [Gemmatimonadota bacterium]